MEKTVCSHELDKVCTVLDQLSHDTKRMTQVTFEALLNHSRKKLDEVGKIGVKIDLGAKQLTQMVLSAKEESSLLHSTTIVEVANELQNVKHSIDKIALALHNKIDEGVLFSDKAVLELKDFFGAAVNGLTQIHDLILTKNPVLIQHVIQNSEKYEAIGRKYAEEHEDRLIKGICLPKSSLIYLVILDAIKDILWYIKTIALAFSEEQ